ncbi:MAG: capsule assembly Wzi family protein [bacterium]
MQSYLKFRTTSSKLIILLVTIFLLLATIPFAAELSPNVPLSHWSYPLLDKLAALGLVTESMLNTKPYTRIEAAKMVNEALKNLDEYKTADTTAHSKWTELANDIINRLQKEFAIELQSLNENSGVSNNTYLKPVDEIYGEYLYGNKVFQIENRQGDKFAQHSNFRIGFDSYGQWANMLGYYLHPEYRYSDSEYNQGKLVEGYAKGQFGNLEIEVGRDSFWWGPGYHGDWILTDNAAPFDMIKLSNAEPILLPWIFRRLGPMDITTFLTKLEENRDYPYTRLWGMRVGFKPTPAIEFGVSRSALFGGEGRPSMSFSDYLDMILGQGEHDPNNLRTDQIAGFDCAWQINNLDRKLHVLRTMKIYIDGAGEDFAYGGPLPSRWAWLYGISFGDIGLNGKNDFRIEYANDHVTADDRYPDPGYWYTHPLYTSGYTYYGTIIGHELGSDGNDLLLEWTHFFSPSWRGSLTYDVHKWRLADTTPAKIQYLQPQLTFYGKDNYTISAAYRYEKETAGNERGTDQTNHIIFLNTTYSF